MNDLLLSQRDLVALELDQRIDQARESGGPTVPGFGSLEELEKQHLQIQADLERTRRDVADRQRALERAILQHEVLKENVEVGDAMHADFSAMLESGIDDFIEANVSKSPEAGSLVLRGLVEMAPRQLFIERWPGVRKSIQGKVKELDKAIKTMMKETNE